MKTFGIKWLMLAVVCMASLVKSTEAEAQIYFQPRFMYLEETNGSSTGDFTRRRTLIDIALGYGWDNGFALGGIYATEKDHTSSSAGGSGDQSRTSYGPSVGWFGKEAIAPYVMGTYYFGSKLETGSTTFNGWGYQIDLGLNFQMGPGSMGIQFSYKRFEYKKATSGGTEVDLSSPLKEGFIDPYIAYRFTF